VTGGGREAKASCWAYATCHPLLSSLTKYPPRVAEYLDVFDTRRRLAPVAQRAGGQQQATAP